MSPAIFAACLANAEIAVLYGYAYDLYFVIGAGRHAIVPLHIKP